MENIGMNLFIGAPVTVNAKAKNHERAFEQSLFGQQGQIVDFGDSHDSYDVIVSFPDVPDFGAFNGSMLDMTQEDV